MFKNIQSKLGITKEGETNIVEALHEMPKREKGKQMPSYKRGGAEPGHVYNADLLYLPDDNGFKYLLVCVDTITGITGAAPMRNREAKDVRAAFEKIFMPNQPLQMPKSSIHLDPGAEFRGTTQQYFRENNVLIRYGKVGRSRQQAMSENRNKIIAKALFQKQVGHEIQDEEVNTEWVADVPVVIAAINEYEKEQYETRRKKWEKQDAKHPPVPYLNDKEAILEVGTKVRVKLDKPENVFGAKQHGTSFRATDIRWKPQVRKITNVLLTPRQPVMYQVDGETTGYTRQQLQLVDSNEMPPNVAPKATNIIPEAQQPAPAPAAEVVANPQTVAQVDAVIAEKEKEKEKVTTTRSGRNVKKKNKLDI